MAKQKKNKLSELDQTHGALEPKQKTTLSQVWAEANGKYSTTNESDYVFQITKLNKSDLWSHASRVGLAPIDPRERLEKALIREFRKYVDSITPRPSPAAPRVHSEAAKAIAAEGR